MNENLEKEIPNRFKISKGIGEGGSSVVYKAFDIINQRKCALKIFNKEKLKEIYYSYDYDEKDEINNEIIKSIKNEAKIMEICKSKNVVELYEFLETHNLVILVLELCDCDLYYYLDHKFKNKNMDIAFIQKIFNDLNEAIKVIHQNNIIHRDIKLKNIFIKYEGDNDFIVKLGDFGISKKINDIEAKCSTHCGTLKYMAPEILKDELYDYKCDLYSLGVCLYYLIFREFPFSAVNAISLLHQMIMYNVKLLKETGIKSLDNLLRGLIEISPEKRISMDEYLNHPFFKEDIKQFNNFVEIEKEENKFSYTKNCYFTNLNNYKYMQNIYDKIKKKKRR